jgi:hypothetical protein
VLNILTGGDPNSFTQCAAGENCGDVDSINFSQTSEKNKRDVHAALKAEKVAT